MAERRPIATRSRAWAQALGRGVAHAGIHANAVSLSSIVFAGAASVALLVAPGAAWRGWLLLAAIGIQLRLVANMIDGMVAVEHGDATPTGALFNEIPDRLSDSAILVCAGYACTQAVLGWACALAAMLTAYVRVLGGALGTPQFFVGPQSKSQRMAVLTVALVVGAALPTFEAAQALLCIALAVVLVGSAVTVVRRLRRIATELDAHAA